MRARLGTILTTTLLASSLWADSRLRVDVSAGGGYTMGTTRYRMDGTTVASQLDFPLDQKALAARIELAMLRDGRPDWTVAGEVVQAIDDPGGTFDDRDWYLYSDGSEFLFSTTESQVEGSMTRLRGDASKTFLSRGKFDLAVFVGFAHETVSQTAIDVVGGQYIADSSGGGRWVYFDYNARALTYDIDYYQSLIGLMPRYYATPTLTIEGQGAISPVLYMKDLDDHILRGFTSVSDGYGFGASGRLSARFEPRQRAREHRWFLLLIGEYYYARLNRSTVVEYYREVEGEDYPVGTKLYGIPHEIVSNRFALRLQVGVSF